MAPIYAKFTLKYGNVAITDSGSHKKKLLEKRVMCREVRSHFGVPWVLSVHPMWKQSEIRHLSVNTIH